MELTGSAQTHQEILRLAAFNVFAHNRNDHSKNFAFLMDQTGSWKLAPAYDLTFSSSSHGQHSTMCAGNGVDPGTKELLELVDYFSISKGKEIIEMVKHIISQWNRFADRAEVTLDSKRTIANTILPLLKR